jgi:XTP/dITP diphosphohydrolase
LTEFRFLIASTNKGKIKEIQALLKDLPLSVFSLQDLVPFESYEETGKTFLENARGKSLFYSHRWKDFILGEDSGLEIDHLEGAPGIFSARFSGPDADDEKNIQKVLFLLKNTPSEKRQARFVSSMVLSKQGRSLKEIEESTSGYITQEKKGTEGFGYDPIFYYPPLRKTFAQLSPDTKNQVSHRGKALRKLREFIQEII